MPIVTINLLRGRTIDQKRKASEEITRVIVEVLKAHKDDVEITFNEIDSENFSRGGKLLIDTK